MSNVMLGFPNRTDDATLSGGSWTTTLPLINLQNRVIGKVARTSGVLLTDTQFDINFGISRPIRIVDLTNHSFSIIAQYRIRGSTVSNFATTVYDSGWLDVWPTVYPYSTLEWEDDAYWTGKYTAEETEGYTTALIHILPATKIAQYWRVEIDDTMNTSGYLDIGRVFIGPAWQPSCNPDYSSMDIGWETNTDIQSAKGGTEYFQSRTPYRVVSLVIPYLDQDESFAKAFEIQRRAGIDKEIVFIHDPDEVDHSLRRRFLGRLRKLSPLEYPCFDKNKVAFEIKELL